VDRHADELSAALVLLFLTITSAWRAVVRPVINNPANGRFELDVEGELATLDYIETGSTIELRHTQVPPALEGRGIGSALAQAALEYARLSGKRMIPTCPFVRHYINRHPAWADLADPQV
jgi:predicted GNAT family acetyltransferase